jgi:hypothetical protein
MCALVVLHVGVVGEWGGQSVLQGRSSTTAGNTRLYSPSAIAALPATATTYCVMTCTSIL